MAKKSNLMKKMKENIAKSGTSKREVIYFAPDSVKRVRFLQEMDDGYEFQFHNDWDTKIYVPCNDQEDHEDCPFCKDGISLMDTYAFSVWDYDSNSVKILHSKASGVSPIPSLIEAYEEYGSLTERDFKIKKIGKGQGSSFSVIGMDKTRFRNSKAKPYSYSEMEDIFKKAFTHTNEEVDDSEDEDDEVETKKSKKSKSDKKKNKKSPEDKLRETLEDLNFSNLKSIARELGMSKKEIKECDESDLIDEFLDNYEIEEIQDLVDDLDSDDGEDDEVED